MAEPRPRKFWRISRWIFRWTRISLLFAIFLGVFAIAYFHEVGIPNFVKRRLVQKIHETGFNVQFSNMHWSWPIRISIEHPEFSTTNNSSIKIVADAFEVELQAAAATKRQIRIDSVSLIHGRVTLPVGTNQQTIVLTNIETSISLSGDSTLRMDQLRGEFEGANIQITGTLTNADAVKDWNILQHPQIAATRPVNNPLQKFLNTWKEVKFTSPPDLSIKFSGDASKPEDIQLEASVTAKSKTETPWGKAKNFRMRGTYPNQLTQNSKRIAELSSSADVLETRYGTADKLNVALTVSEAEAASNSWTSTLSFNAVKVDAQWNTATVTNRVTATGVQWNGDVVCSRDLKPHSLKGKLHLESAQSTWGEAQQVQATIQMVQGANVTANNESWGFWKPLAPWLAEWTLDLRKLKTPTLEMHHAFCTGTWRAPQISIHEIEAELYDGNLKLSGELDVVSRKADLKLFSSFDLHQLSALLPKAGKSTLQKFTWEKPPQIAAELHSILPPWTDEQTNWPTKILPTIQLSGNASVEQCFYESIPILSTKAEFVYSNFSWDIPSVHIIRPEGALDVSLRSTRMTGDNHWIIDSSINPKDCKSLFSADLQDVFDKISLGCPPTLHAEIFERGFNFRECGIHADFVVTNVAFRGLDLDFLKGALIFTNQLLAFSDVRVEQGEKLITCPNAEIDFKMAKVFLHEVYSTMDPMPVTRAIGRKVAAAIEPYHFHKAPTVYVEGSFVFDHPETGDMHFIVEGEQFEWGVFKADKAIGKVDWIGETLSITNVTASAYRGGEIEGWVYVDVGSRPGNDFRIGVTVTNLDLQSGLVSLGKATHMEGTLSGKVNLTAANTKDLKHWQGFGWMQLKDGLIWEVPIFGIFSPVLNAIAPGTGNSRAREALATFIITNSIIRSDDLEIHSPAVRINYRGTVNFDEQVDAKVDAQILRDAGSLGHIVSIALQPLTKAFEYKLTGSLEDPKSEPVFIPKILMTVLRPFNSLKKILPEKTESPSAKQQSPAETTTAP